MRRAQMWIACVVAGAAVESHWYGLAVAAGLSALCIALTESR